MIPLDEAIATVLAGCRPLEPEVRPLADAAGCVLVDDVTAAEAVPPFANTAMDGYAVRAADVASVPVELPVVAEVAAGHPAVAPLAAGQAMRIFTGAPMPDGADAVVMVEETSRLDGGARVEIRASVATGTHVRAAGDDVRPGEVVVHGGDELTPGRIGVLRSVGVDTVRVRPQPRVGVLSTGDELVTGPEPLQPGQIRDSNRPTLLAMVAAAGAVAVDLGHVPDDRDALTAAFTGAVERCDAVLSTGGVSMGDTDLVKVVLDELGNAAGPDVGSGGGAPGGGAQGGGVPGGGVPGGGMRWMQVAIKPAKPLAFGVIGPRRVPVFGLPGNPVSSMVSFELFARPGLRRLAGYAGDRLHRIRLAAVADEPLDRRIDGKVNFVRVVARAVDGVLRVRSAGGQGSHQLSAMARANALAVLPDGPGVAAGEPVEVVVLGDVAAAAS